MVSFFTDLSTELIYPLLPLFLSKVLNSSNTFIGLIEGIAISTASILRIFSGIWSDRIKKRKLFAIIGYGLSNLAKPFTGLATRGWHVLFLRFIDRTGKGIRTAPRDALIAESTHKKHYGISYGFHRAMDTLGATLGPLSAFFLLRVLRNDFRKVFYLSLLPGLLALVVLVLFVKEKGTSEKKTQPLSLKMGFSKPFYILLLSIGLFTLGNSSDAFLILRANTFLKNDSLIPLLWFGFNLVYVLVSIPAGYIADRWSRKGMIIVGMFIYSSVYAGLSFNINSELVVFLFLLYGVYYGFTEGNIRAYLAQMVPPDKKATAFGLYHTTVGLLAFPASFLFGILWDRFGPSFPFRLGAILAIISALILMGVKKE